MIARLFRRGPPPDPATVRVLMVCMGNICRSPLAEGALRARLAARDALGGGPLPVVIDSAGTHGYHAGAAPDPRAQAAASRRGIDISRQRARQVVVEDLVGFDLVLAMDDENRAALQVLAPPEHVAKVRLLLDFAGPDLAGRSVPDPYYGGVAGFERVLDLVEQAMTGLIDEIERTVSTRRSSSG